MKVGFRNLYRASNRHPGREAQCLDAQTSNDQKGKSQSTKGGTRYRPDLEIPVFPNAQADQIETGPQGSDAMCSNIDQPMD